MADVTTPPDGPGPRKEFNENVPAPEPPKPDIATAKELEWRESMRATKEAELHHTVGGTTEEATHTSVDGENELRIKALSDRLNSAKHRLENGQKRGRGV